MDAKDAGLERYLSKHSVVGMSRTQASVARAYWAAPAWKKLLLRLGVIKPRITPTPEKGRTKLHVSMTHPESNHKDGPKRVWDNTARDAYRKMSNSERTFHDYGYKRYGVRG